MDIQSMTMATRRLMRNLLALHRSSRLNPSPCSRNVFSSSYDGSLYGVTSSWKPHGALKDHQDALPCQPVPPLKQTMERFLASVRPLLDDEEYNRAVKLTEDFSRSGGDGENLQHLLEKRATEKENWLADWWIKVAYLGYRDPVTVYVNPSFVAEPLDQYTDPQGRERCAAISIASVLNQKEKVDNQTVPIEMIGKTPQCMMQYFHILGCTRIPGDGVDHVVCHHKQDPSSPRHVTVICNNNFFHVDVLDADGNPMNVSQIQSQLDDVVSQSLTRGPAVGILTSDNRDSWYRNYMELSKDPQNAAHLASIQQSLFVVALDDLSPDYSRDRHYDVMCPLHFTGGGTELNGGNRWHDKIFQVNIAPGGVFGFGYEHSVAEGPPVLGILEKILRDLSNPPPIKPAATGTIQKPKRLDFNLNDSLKTAITETNEKTVRLYKSLDTNRYLFTGYGRDFAKSLKLSPDGYVQAHMQLAHYMLHGHLVSTYESGSLRKFRLGRTDTIRSVSIPVHNWCKAMMDPDASSADRLNLLREAVTHHRWYTDQVVQGQAIDRHLLGLKLTALDNGLDMPAFLKDPIYDMSVHWSLSTTTVPLKGGIVMFGPVVEDGYGIYYNTKKDCIDFGITTWRSCTKTDSHQMAQSLEKAFMATYKTAGEAAKL